MPEVCEVVLTALYLTKLLKNKQIKSIKVLGGRYKKKPLDNLNKFNDLLPLKITKIDSKGKQLWFELQNKKYILSHFGMDGRWYTEKENNSNIEFIIKDKEKEFSLYFIDSRNFGRLEFMFNTKDFNNKIDQLGEDLLKEKLTVDIMKKRMERYMFSKGKLNKKSGKKIIKVLMEGQKKSMGIGSGIGNYLAVEILYRSKISPHTSIYSIYKNVNLLETFVYNIKYVLKLCFITNKTGYMNNLKDFLDEYRKKDKYPDYHKDIKIKKKDEFCYLVYRRKKDNLNNNVKAEKIISGRTTYWVPVVQK